MRDKWLSWLQKIVPAWGHKAVTLLNSSPLHHLRELIMLFTLLQMQSQHFLNVCCIIDALIKYNQSKILTCRLSPVVDFIQSVNWPFREGTKEDVAIQNWKPDHFQGIINFHVWGELMRQCSIAQLGSCTNKLCICEQGLWVLVGERGGGWQV